MKPMGATDVVAEDLLSFLCKGVFNVVGLLGGSFSSDGSSFGNFTCITCHVA